MSRDLAICIISILFLASCGGGGGSSGASPDVSAFGAARDGLRSLYDRSEDLDYTELSAARLGGSYSYAGYVGLSRIGNASSLTVDEINRQLADIEPEDFLDTPQVTGRFAMTANFNRGTIAGRVTDFQRANDQPVAGELTLGEGRIDDGYFHYSATLAGNYNGAAIANGLLLGDFGGEKAEYAGGALAFQAGGDAIAGVFLGGR